MSDNKTPREKPQILDKAGVRVSLDKEDGLPIIESHPSIQPKTLEDILALSNADLEKYEVERWEPNSWGQMSKDNGLVTLHQIKAKLRLRDLSKTNLNEIFAKGWAAFKKGMAMPTPIAKPNPKGKGVMVEFAIPDLHLGKLAWNPETGGGNYDTNIACIAHREALADLVSAAPAAEEAWFLIGNDFFNSDSHLEQTTNGTPQHEDGRWQKTFVQGKELLMEAIGVLRKKYPKVVVIVMPGNHDRTRMFYVGESLVEAFRGVKGVTIDNRPVGRKYYRWGQTGFGFAHGDGLKAKDIPHLCQQEARELWGLTTRFEFHHGHLHQEIVRWAGSVLCRVLPSLTPPDAWHASKGYTMVEKAAMAYVYSQKGLRNQIVHYPRPELFT